MIKSLLVTSENRLARLSNHSRRTSNLNKNLEGQLLKTVLTQRIV